MLLRLSRSQNFVAVSPSPQQRSRYSVLVPFKVNVFCAEAVFLELKVCCLLRREIILKMNFDYEVKNLWESYEITCGFTAQVWIIPKNLYGNSNYKSRFYYSRMIIDKTRKIWSFVGFEPTSLAVWLINHFNNYRMAAPECIPLTMEPESKFYTDPVLVLDFQSLYPSMCIAYNYCYSTCLGKIANYVK